MARRLSKNRWADPDYKFCYCYPRKIKNTTLVYTSVFGKRRSTPIKWKAKNKIDIKLNELFYVISFGQK